jgi:hypothetical protein
LPYVFWQLITSGPILGHVLRRVVFTPLFSYTSPQHALPKFVPGQPPGPWSGKISTKPTLTISTDVLLQVSSNRSWFDPWPQYTATFVLAVALKAADATVAAAAARMRGRVRKYIMQYKKCKNI